MFTMPQTVSAKDVQTSYRNIFNKANTSMSPIFVLKNNQPDVAIMGIKSYTALLEKSQKAELLDAMDSIKLYRKEKRLGTLIRGKDLKDLIL